MTENKTSPKKTLSLSAKPTLGLKNPVGAKAGAGSHVKKSISIEIKKKRTGLRPSPKSGTSASDKELSTTERDARAKALLGAKDDGLKSKLNVQQLLQKARDEEKQVKELEAKQEQKEEALDLEALKAKETQERDEINARIDSADEKKKTEAQQNRSAKEAETEAAQPQFEQPSQKLHFKKPQDLHKKETTEEEEAKQKRSPLKNFEEKRQHKKLTVSQALTGFHDDHSRYSIASPRRHKKKKSKQFEQEKIKLTREVILPDIITVSDLANRMSEKTADVVKALINLGMMVTANQKIDAETAELIIEEFGHKVQRVSASDVEQVIETIKDDPKDLLPRPPVVTIMGHVDHGKTSLLDAMRLTDVVSKEAGGITQHIGAYQIQIKSGEKITFIDTPGHAAFTEMRARGANVTDIVILVVAADDSIMPQTIEAINHAKAANVPIIIAINKCDLPAANPMKVKQDLLQHNILVEDMGGEILCVEVSAKAKLNLDKLQEAILLQAEMLELKANPDRKATGIVVESKVEQGRGTVATVLVQNGTLKIGDIFVAGAEYGRVRAIIDDHRKKIKKAGPSLPVEIIGLSGTPMAGDPIVVTESETKAREISEYRKQKIKDAQEHIYSKSRLEDMFTRIQADEMQELPIILKSDVQGSIEAITSSIEKLASEEHKVRARIIHSSVGAISEADITLANASNAVIIAFNVRANPQAKDLASKENIEIKYYSIIYNIIDDMKSMMSGLLAPKIKETFTGYAEIREVFNITKVGKVAGCMVTSGTINRGSGVRLLRDNVVIHEGKLKTLKRFKDEVKEVKESYECGMAFENYDDMKVGDQIEAFIVEEIEQNL